MTSSKCQSLPRGTLPAESWECRQLASNGRVGVSPGGGLEGRGDGSGGRGGGDRACRNPHCPFLTEPFLR